MKNIDEGDAFAYRAGDRKMKILPKVTSMYEIDGFMATIVPQRVTGLSCDILLECIASERLSNVQPYVFAICEDWLYPISISKTPGTLDDIGLEGLDFTDVYKWVANNYELLTRHWNCQIDDLGIHEALWEQYKIRTGKYNPELHDAIWK